MKNNTTLAPVAGGSALVGLAKILLQEGVLDEKKILEIMATCQSEKIPLIQGVARQSKAVSKVIAGIMARMFELPLVDIEGIDKSYLTDEVMLDQKKMIELRAIPIFVRGPKMFVLTSDPTNAQSFDFFTHKTGKRLELLVVDDNQITSYLSTSASNDAVANVESGVDSDLEFGETPGQDSGEMESQDADDNPVVKFVNGVLLTAIRKGASDIHFEPYETFYRVRIRVDGALRDITRPASAWALRIASRIKIISSLDISEKRKPQDGRMKLKLSSTRAIDFRVSTLPTMYGEKIVMRILDPSAAQMGIEALGYEPEEKARLLEAINRPYGMVLVTGPTGSGKTVSLYTCLNLLNKEDINISTAEDPCEIQIAGINQVNVNPAAGLTFASALKSFLRQDPDIIMVGEIRDEETAEISIKAAATGHLVLATLHTNDAPKTIARLVEIGVKPYNVASAVILITAQRLARKLCEFCKVPDAEASPASLRSVGMLESEAQGVHSLWKPFKANKSGCDACNHGYKGRVGLYQVMPISEGIQELIMRGANSMEIAALSKKEGIRDLRQSALLKYRKGLMSMDEVTSVTNE